MSNRQYKDNSSDDGLTVGQLDAAVQDRQRIDADSGAATSRFILLYALAWAGGGDRGKDPFSRRGQP